MRRVIGLFERLVTSDHLDASARDFVRGKRRRADVAAFLFRREEVLSRLGMALAEGSWRPAGFTPIRVHDPKPRVIARAPVEDRIVQAAIGALLEPILLRTATDDNFACRTGYGTQRALLRLQEGMDRHPKALHLDVRAYFASINIDILRGLLGARIADARFLGLLDRILEAGVGLYDSPEDRAFLGLDEAWPPRGRGLPVGALTSQLLATHLYLEGLDHFVKRVLHVPAYVRYVDDLFLFGDGLGELRGWGEAVGEWLWCARDLKLKRPEAPVLSCGGHLDALGVRLRRGGQEPLPGALRRLGGVCWTAARAGRVSTPRDDARLVGMIGHLVG